MEEMSYEKELKAEVIVPKTCILYQARITVAKVLYSTLADSLSMHKDALRSH